ncbi:MAG: MtrB/PioB family decaheme-associated outer membrane protein [Gammaproteobacteria bacterium]|nr:MtrB/PioB family decaheme-associated outer membrane protein [Gammaproteobacteria bacterium]
MKLKCYCLASSCFFLLMQTTVSVAVDQSAHYVAKHWKCKWCDYQEGRWGGVELGIGYVSDDAYRFGRETGLDDKGFYLIGNANTHYQDEAANFWDLRVRNIGTDSRWLSAEGGQQGSYKFWLGYSEIPYFLTDTARSPYLADGSESLVLPTDWVPGNTTDVMQALRSSLQTLQLGSERTSYTLGTTLYSGYFGETYSLKFNRDYKNGMKAIGVAYGGSDAFTSLSVLLPTPIDYMTDQLEFDVAYSSPTWQIRMGYYGSFFKNGNGALSWQNPYADLQSNTGLGRRALVPDNEFHQLYFSGGYQFSSTMRVTWYSAAGVMLQDENFLPYTINPMLGGNALPAKSLQGKARTWTFNVNLFSRPRPTLTWKVNYAHNEQNNKTDRTIWDSVVTDALQSLVQRQNPRYSFRNRSAKATMRHRLDNNNKIMVGVDYGVNERDNQSVEKIKKRNVWVKWKYKLNTTFDAAVKLAKAQRDGDNYRPLSEIIEPENRLLRKYNLADKEGDAFSAVLSYRPLNRLNLGLNINYSDDDYADSLLGLSHADYYSYSLDAICTLTKSFSFSVFYTWERYTSKQAGSQIFSNPDWFSKNQDKIYILGVGVKHTSARQPIEWGIDYLYSSAIEKQVLSGDIQLTNESLPEANNSLQRLQLYANYQLRESLRIKLSAAYEKYVEDDYSVDGIEVDTYSQLLSLGYGANDYGVYVVSASIRYGF